MLTIYGADWCEYCKKAVAYCEQNNIQYNYVDITLSTDPRVNSFRKIPQIYNGDQHIGGYTELVESNGSFPDSGLLLG